MSLCTSSSNPLTNLQKHLHSAPPPPPSSSSSAAFPPSNASAPSRLRSPIFRNPPADAEFAAFEEAGFVSGLRISAPPAQWRPQLQQQRQQRQRQQWFGGGWHQEFMMMGGRGDSSAHVWSSPPPPPPHLSGAFIGKGATGSNSRGGEEGVGVEAWEREGRMREKMPMMHQTQSPYLSTFPRTLPQTSSTLLLPPQGPAPLPATATATAVDALDDAAFEAAFAAAAAALSSPPQEGGRQQEGTEEEEERVEQEEEKEEEKSTDDIAKTAANLLDSLSSESSKKFRESEFMALMRRLRDGEVRVVGNKMVEVGI